MKPLKPGRCMICGCTDRYGCSIGCAWIDSWRVLCSRCAWNMAVYTLALIRKERP